MTYAPIGVVESLVKASALVLMLHVGLCVAADTHGPPDPKQGYRFVIKADGGGSIAIRGLITVDGKDRLIEREETPFEFRCEGGTVVAGYFEVLKAGRSLRLSVFDPVYSKRRSALNGKGFDHIRFSWAQPGAGPRCADSGEGACPSATPSVEEFRKRLESMRKASP